MRTLRFLWDRWVRIHCAPPRSDLEATFPGSICQGFNLAVVQKTTTVKICLFYTGLLGALSNLSTNCGRSFDVVLANKAKTLFEGRGGCQCLARHIVDQLNRDVFGRAVHGKTQTTCVDLAKFVPDAHHPYSGCLCPCRARACAIGGCSRRLDQQAVRQCLPQSLRSAWAQLQSHPLVRCNPRRATGRGSVSMCYPAWWHGNQHPQSPSLQPLCGSCPTAGAHAWICRGA